MTSRPSKDPNKIKYVELVKNRYVYRPYIPLKERGSLRVDKRGFLAPPVRLCHKDAQYHELLSAHAKAVRALALQVDPYLHTLKWYNEQYQASDEFLALATDSQRKARSLSRLFDHEITLDGKREPLSILKPSELTKPMVRQIRQLRFKAYRDAGKKGNVQCNREIAYARRMINWAGLMFDDIGNHNPFSGIDALEEPKNDRYITDAEYIAQRNLAHEVADYLPVVMDLMYCFAARGVEVTDIELANVLELDRDGEAVTRVRRRKGSKTTMIRNRPQVQASIDAALALHENRTITGKYLLPGMNGPKMVKSTLDAAMSRLNKLMTDRGTMSQHTFTEYQDEHESPLYFTLHRIKAKAITDADNKALAGQSKRMQDHYDKSVGSFEPPEAAVFELQRHNETQRYTSRKTMQSDTTDIL